MERQRERERERNNLLFQIIRKSKIAMLLQADCS